MSFDTEQNSLVLPLFAALAVIMVLFIKGQWEIALVALVVTLGAYVFMHSRWQRKLAESREE